MAASTEFTVVEISRNFRVFSGATLIRSSVPMIPSITIPDFEKEITNSIAWKATDCTIIIIWHTGEEWKISTSKLIDCQDYTTPGRSNTFREMLSDTAFSSVSFSTFDITRTYLFRLIHPGTQRVCKSQSPKIDFLYSFSSRDDIIESVDFTSPAEEIFEVEKFDLTNFSILKDMDPYIYTGLIVMMNPTSLPTQYQVMNQSMVKHEALFGYRTPYAAFYASEKTEENKREFLEVYPDLEKYINLFFYSKPVDSLALIILTVIDPRLTGGKLSKFTEALKTKKIPRPLHIFICKFMSEFRFSPIIEIEHIKRLLNIAISKITTETISEVIHHAFDFTV